MEKGLIQVKTTKTSRKILEVILATSTLQKVENCKKLDAAAQYPPIVSLKRSKQ